MYSPGFRDLVDKILCVARFPVDRVEARCSRHAPALGGGASASASACAVRSESLEWWRDRVLKGQGRFCLGGWVRDRTPPDNQRTDTPGWLSTVDCRLPTVDRRPRHGFRSHGPRTQRPAHHRPVRIERRRARSKDALHGSQLISACCRYRSVAAPSQSQTCRRFSTFVVFSLSSSLPSVPPRTSRRSSPLFSP